MRVKSLLLIMTTGLLFIISCEEQIDITSRQYEKHLVVFGSITDQNGPYTVQISHSAPVDKVTFKPYSGCVVTIFEKSGENELLTEVEPGTYQTRENRIQGEPGKSYCLDILTPEGKTYTTDYQEMKEPIGIDTIFTRLEYKEQRSNPEDLAGYQFYISTQTSDEPIHLLWMLEETYQFNADYLLAQTIDKGIVTRYNDPDSIYTCWRSTSVHQLFTEQTTGLSAHKLTQKPLHFVGTSTKKLQNKYSLLVKQYSLNEAAFRYWSQLEEQADIEEFLFSKQPFQLKGNVYNPENMDELVLGYFNVASLSEQRIFVNPPNVPLTFTKCAINWDTSFAGIISQRKIVYMIYLNEEDQYGMVEENCIDCRLEGGTTEKPEFWPDS